MNCAGCTGRMRTQLLQRAMLRRGAESARYFRQNTAVNEKHQTVIFSGIQPTAAPHIGNYFGALQNWKTLQDEAVTDANTFKIVGEEDQDSPKNAANDEKSQTELLFSIVDLHALTVPWSPETLSKTRREMFACLLSIGIDPEKSCLFFQSDVPEHSQLTWILETITSIGSLSRMTQWRAKAQQQQKMTAPSSPQSINFGEESSNTKEALSKLSAESTRLGLFTYPVLMAADVLLYNATHVPVGEDQVQHLELTRTLANAFNRAVGAKILTAPKTVLTSFSRIMSLRNPTEKMSKSAPNPLSRVMLFDSDVDIKRKIGSAVTDSESSVGYDPENRPGCSNLIAILAALRKQSIEHVMADLEGNHHSELKQKLASELIEQISPIRDRYFKIRESDAIRDLMILGAQKARKKASQNLARIHDIIGLAAI